MVGIDGKKRFCRDDRGRQPAFHVAGAATIDFAVAQLAAKRVFGPAAANLDHICVAVEMHAIARPRAFVARDNIPAWVFVAVARRAVGADQLGRKARLLQALVQIVADFAIAVARRVQCGDADQIAGQRDQVIAAVLDGGCQRIGLRGVGHGQSIRASGRTDNRVILKLHSPAIKAPQTIAMMRPGCYGQTA